MVLETLKNNFKEEVIMKKIVCLLLSFIFVLSFAACGKKEDNSNSGDSSKVADTTSVTLINSAYAKTAEAISKATALGYKADVKRAVTVDNKTESMRLNSTYNFIIKDDKRLVDMRSELTAQNAISTSYFYSDGARVFAHKMGSTYVLSDNDSTKEFMKKNESIPEICDAAKLKVVDTVIVNTSDGGKGFVFEYDTADTNFDAAKVFDQFFTEKDSGVTIKPSLLRISGIMDSEGRLSSQTVTYVYTYDYEEDVENEDVDPDNSGASSTKKVTKTAKVELSIEVTLNYGLTEVKPYGDMNIPEENAADTFKEMTIEDFNLLTK